MSDPATLQTPPVERQLTFIRPAIARDAAALASLAERCFREAWEASSGGPDLDDYCARQFSIERIATSVGDTGATWLLAEVDDLVGFACLVAGDAPAAIGGHNPLQLSRIYTLRNWHGRGPGPALMQACLRRAARGGHDPIWLSVWKDAPQSQAFYRKWGFEIAGEAAFVMGTKVFEDWLLRRRVMVREPGVTLRRHRREDAGPILALFRDTIRRVNRRDYTPGQVEAWAQPGLTVEAWADRLREATWVVEAEGQLVAFAELEPDGYIDCFYCHADWQGVGIGSRLMRQLQMEARAAGAQSMFSDVSLTARSFFERHGFIVERSQQVRLGGERLTNFRMRRPL